MLGTVCEAALSRKCPEATSCTRKPERSVELSVDRGTRGADVRPLSGSEKSECAERGLGGFQR